MTQSQHIETYMQSIGYRWDAGVGMWRHQTNISLEGSVAELMWRQTVMARRKQLRRVLRHELDVWGNSREERYLKLEIAELGKLLEKEDAL